MKKFLNILIQKLPLLLFFIAAIVAVINIYYQKDNLNNVVFDLLLVAVFIYAKNQTHSQNELQKKLQKELDWAKFENTLLRWSYQDMGKYIDKMNIPELSDINLRIDNELRDIDIKKNMYAERREI